MMIILQKGRKIIASFSLLIFVLFLAVGQVEARQGKRAGYSKRGPAASGSIRKHRAKKIRKAHKRRVKRAVRAEVRRDIRDDRRDRRQDRRDDRRDRRRIRRLVGGVTLGAMALSKRGCQMERVVIDDFTYHQCGDKWYEQAYVGGDVTYIQIHPPDDY